MGENKDKLFEIISKIFMINKEKIDDNLSKDSVENWDSMNHLMVISELESNFNISIDDKEVVNIRNIKDIKNILKNHNIDV